MRTWLTILLLFLSNIFMTFAWYGHLKLKQMRGWEDRALWIFILVSWLIALPEYCLQVPANRLGFTGTGGPFSLMQLKVLQEVISLMVFVVFSLLVFRTETLRWNHLVGLVLLVLAVYFVFKK